MGLPAYTFMYMINRNDKVAPHPLIFTVDLAKGSQLHCNSHSLNWLPVFWASAAALLSFHLFAFPKLKSNCIKTTLLMWKTFLSESNVNMKQWKKLFTFNFLNNYNRSLNDYNQGLLK